MLHVTTLLPPEHWLAILMTHFNGIYGFSLKNKTSVMKGFFWQQDCPITA